MSGDELLLLTSSAEPVNEAFFEALARARRIHQDCEVLLGGENEHLGLEIMEQSSRGLNSAYQKLYKWIQREFKSLNLEDPQMGGSIRRGLRVLAERPSLFHNCLDSFAEAREDILSEAFHFALTSGGSEGAERGGKPIEFNAHDPLRYVGDMLAWVYSAAVSEREALEGLFIADGGELAREIQTGISSEPWSRIDGEEAAFDGQKVLTDLVTRALGGVFRSLGQRIELVIQGHDDPVALYKVVNLLAFYESTFSKVVGSNSPLVENIVSLQKFTLQRFETLMQDIASTAASDPSALHPSDDLSAPEFLVDALTTLTALMKTYDSSFRPDNSSQDENEFTPIVRAALDPFMELAEKSAEAVSGPLEMAVFRVNSLLAVRSAISPFPFVCSTYLANLSAELTSLRTQLLDIQHNFLLESSGLKTLLSALKEFAPVQRQTAPDPSSLDVPRPPQPNLITISSLPEFQPAPLSAVSQKLDDFLPSALVDASDNLKRIHSPAMVKSITEEAVEAFCRDFAFVESVIMGADEARERVSVGTATTAATRQTDATDRRKQRRRRLRIMRGEQDEEEEEKMGDGWSLRALFPRTSGEIRVLLS
jgi:hypothetical protein